jgi:Protein of unknown function (DUF1570)
MHRWRQLGLMAVFLLACALGAVPRAAETPGADEWKYDVVNRKKGAPFHGLVVEQSKTQVVIKCVSRKPGRPTILYEECLPRNEVESVELLDPKERDVLQRRLEALKRERETLDAQLKMLDPGVRVDVSGDALALKPAEWAPDAKLKALTYQSSHFQLVSTAREEVIQLAAIQLEQVYAAYARHLPPRVNAAHPTAILLTRTLGEYQTIVRERGHNFFNAAFYDVAKNQIVCGSNVQRLGDELERIRGIHAKQLKDLENQKAELTQIYKGAIPPAVLTYLLDVQNKIKAQERENTLGFEGAKRRLFRRLYHEAFHAYLATFVYPPSEAEVPRWLNEGLAQIFETAIFEVGELRIGHADKDRLAAVRAVLPRNPPPRNAPPGYPLLPLIELLRSGGQPFQVAHAGDQQVANRFYLASWALAHYLTFERKVLGSKAMDDYVHALKRGVDPVLAFRDLVGQPLGEFEKDYLQYLAQLREDGTKAPK